MTGQLANAAGVRLDTSGAVATITLVNPPLNLVTLDLTARLEAAIDTATADEAVRVIVLRGEGDRAFCAGSDLAEFPGFAAPGAVVEKKLRRENAVFSKVADCPKPTIAVVRGVAFGGGLELAACCDFILSDAAARFALPEIRIGVFPGSGGTIRVTQRIGLARAKQMMLTGDAIDAATAVSWGLVNAAAPADALDALVADRAARLAALPRLALATCKAALRLAVDLPVGEALERTLPLCDTVSTSPECAEGVRAFFERRPPRFA